MTNERVFLKIILTHKLREGEYNYLGREVDIN